MEEIQAALALFELALLLGEQLPDYLSTWLAASSLASELIILSGTNITNLARLALYRRRQSTSTSFRLKVTS